MTQDYLTFPQINQMPASTKNAIPLLILSFLLQYTFHLCTFNHFSISHHFQKVQPTKGNSAPGI